MHDWLLQDASFLGSLHTVTKLQLAINTAIGFLFQDFIIFSIKLRTFLEFLLFIYFFFFTKVVCIHAK